MLDQIITLASYSIDAVAMIMWMSYGQYSGPTLSA